MKGKRDDVRNYWREPVIEDGEASVMNIYKKTKEWMESILSILVADRLVDGSEGT